MIADKERSGYMKPYVEKIETEAMYAEKSWGTYTVMDVQPGSMTIKISMKAGEKMSYHMHSEREEVWTVVSGKGKAIVDDREKFYVLVMSSLSQPDVNIRWKLLQHWI